MADVFKISQTMYDRLLPSVREAYDAHDKSCLSLKHFWYGSRGGVSDIAELWDCVDCNHTFSIYGLTWLNYRECAADAELDEIQVCGCCAVKRGHSVRETLYGITTDD